MDVPELRAFQKRRDGRQNVRMSPSYQNRSYPAAPADTISARRKITRCLLACRACLLRRTRRASLRCASLRRLQATAALTRSKTDKPGHAKRARTTCLLRTDTKGRKISLVEPASLIRHDPKSDVARPYRSEAAESRRSDFMKNSKSFGVLRGLKSSDTSQTPKPRGISSETNCSPKARQPQAPHRAPSRQNRSR
jgi:hypothetical protein